MKVQNMKGLTLISLNPKEHEHFARAIEWYMDMIWDEDSEMEADKLMEEIDKEINGENS